MSGIGYALLVPALSEHYRLSGTVEEVDTTPRIPAGALGAWSCARKLVAAYSGPAIAARNAGGSLAAINFVNNVLDTASLLTHAGGGDVTVRVVYDQSGNGRNLEQITPALQPKIVSGGSLITMSGTGVPAMDFATSRFLSRADACGLTGAPAVTLAACGRFLVNHPSGHPAFVRVGRTGFGTTGGLFDIIGNSNLANNLWVETIGNGKAFAAGANLSDPHFYVASTAAGGTVANFTCTRDGVACGGTGYGGSSAATLNLLNEVTVLGGGNGAAAGVYRDFDGKANMFAVYNAVLSAPNLTDLDIVGALHL